MTILGDTDDDLLFCKACPSRYSSKSFLKMDTGYTTGKIYIRVAWQYHLFNGVNLAGMIITLLS